MSYELPLVDTREQLTLQVESFMLSSNRLYTIDCRAGRTCLYHQYVGHGLNKPTGYAPELLNASQK